MDAESINIRLSARLTHRNIMLIYKLFKGTAFVRNKEEETAPNNKKKDKN